MWPFDYFKKYEEQDYVDAVVFCMKNSVPHGGCPESSVPRFYKPIFTELVEREVFAIKPDIKQENIYVPTMKAVFMLNIHSYADCLSAQRFQWQEYEKSFPNVRVLSYGVVPTKAVHKDRNGQLKRGTKG